MRRNVKWIATAGAVALAVIAVVLAEPWAVLDSEPAAAVTEPETAAVRVQTLAEEFSAEGSLVYADLMTAYAVPTGPPSESVVTEIAAQDTPVDAGEVLWRIGFEPTVLLIGNTPSHRDLASGDVGVDVLQLELNLVALGFDPGATVTVDDTYTANTALMVERWQESIGAEPTGDVARGAVVYAPDDRRVGSVAVSVGDTVSEGQAMVEVTGLDREATFTLTAADRSFVAIGGDIEVRLPDRSEITATVRTITVDEAGGAEVTAGVDDPTDLRADNQPITASWSLVLADQVLTVPESALLRLDSGTYYVELASGGGLVEVEPRSSSGGWVEVTGNIAPDDLVVAP